MRNAKSIIILLFLVFAVATANVYLQFGGGKARTAQRHTLAVLQEDVVSVSVRRKGSPATELRRRSGAWRIVSPFAGGADRQVVLRLLDALSQVPVTDVISDSELLKLDRTRADFSLEDPILDVSLTMESGEAQRVSFGKTTPSDSGLYASVDGLDAVFVVPPSVLAAVDVSAEGFRRRSLFPIGAEDVSSVGIRRDGNKALEFVRSGDEWRIGDRKASADKIGEFVSGLTSASAVSFVWPVGASNETDHASASLLASYGLEPDAAVTVVLNGIDGESRRVIFGKAVGEGLVYALVQNGDAIVTVPVGLKDAALQDEVKFTDARLFPAEARSVRGFSLAVDGGLYSLSLGKDGLWGLESPIVAPADQETAGTLLSRILALSSADLAAEGVAVSVSTNAEKTIVSRESVLAGLTVESLRSREMLRVDPALVRRVVSTSGAAGAKPLSVVYDRDRRAWHVESSEGDAAVNVRGVENILSAVSPLKASRIVKLNVAAADLEDFGLDHPFLTVAIDQSVEGAVRRNILIGKRTKGGRFATIGSSDAVFVIPDATVVNLTSSLVSQ